jgi:hypothetical protein
VALVERDGGRSIAKLTIDARAETLAPIVRAHVDLSAAFMTDAWRGYITVGREFAGGHYSAHRSTEALCTSAVTIGNAITVCASTMAPDVNSGLRVPSARAAGREQDRRLPGEAPARH